MTERHDSALGDEYEEAGATSVTDPAPVPHPAVVAAVLPSPAARPRPVLISAAPVPSPSPPAANATAAIASSSTAAVAAPAARRSLFSFPWGARHSRRPSSNTAGSGSNDGIQTAGNAHDGAVPLSPTSAAAAAAAAAATGAAAAAAPARRRWWRYPIRVPILALLLVSLLARTSEGYTSLAGFATGFLLFEGFSAPDTGQPNRLDGIMKRAVQAFQRCRRKRRRARMAAKNRRASRASITGAHHPQQPAENVSSLNLWRGRLGKLVHWLRGPCRLCRHIFSRPRHSHAHPHGRNNVGGDTDTDAALSDATPLLQLSREHRAATGEGAPPPPPADEGDDVLLDVALSVTEDPEEGRNAASPPTTAVAPADASGTAADGDEAGAGRGADDALPAVAPPSSSLSRAGSGVAHSPPPSSAPPSTPLHSLSEFADHLADALPSVTVSSLDDGDLLTDEGEATRGVVGGKATFAHVSVSLKFTWRAFHIHLHHWVYLLLLFVFLTLEQTLWSDHAASYPLYAFASAFCLGGSVQGLKYADWRNVIWRRAQESRRGSLSGASGGSGGSAVAGGAHAAASASSSTPSHGSTPRPSWGSQRSHSQSHAGLLSRNNNHTHSGSGSNFAQLEAAERGETTNDMEMEVERDHDDEAAERSALLGDDSSSDATAGGGTDSEHRGRRDHLPPLVSLTRDPSQLHGAFADVHD